MGSYVLCIFLIVTLQSIFVNCEFSPGKTYDFYVSRVPIFMLFSHFLRLNVDVFLGRVSGTFLVRFWDGFWRLWEDKDAKKSTKSVTVVVMMG